VSGEDLIRGTLDLLIMTTIALEPMHGCAITQRIQQISDELLKVQQGSRYPALHPLKHQGWITAEKWERLSAGVPLVLERT
jgi:PadR family transcriptional regulator, regulatory protein PadR